MPIKFTPHYSITTKVIKNLMRIEAVKEKIVHLPLTPTVLASLRETARLYTTHYSTMIEGNLLEPEQVEKVLNHKVKVIFQVANVMRRKLKAITQRLLSWNSGRQRLVLLLKKWYKHCMLLSCLTVPKKLNRHPTETGRMLFERVEQKVLSICRLQLKTLLA